MPQHFYPFILSPITGVMAANKIPPQMANFQTFYRTAFYSFLAAETAHFAHCYFVLNFSISAHFQQILVFRNAPNCSSVHIGMTGISLSELALHNSCETGINGAGTYTLHLRVLYFIDIFLFLPVFLFVLPEQLIFSISPVTTVNNENITFLHNTEKKIMKKGFLKQG